MLYILVYFTLSTTLWIPYAIIIPPLNMRIGRQRDSKLAQVHRTKREVKRQDLLPGILAPVSSLWTTVLCASAPIAQKMMCNLCFECPKEAAAVCPGGEQKQSNDTLNVWWGKLSASPDPACGSGLSPQEVTEKMNLRPVLWWPLLGSQPIWG